MTATTADFERATQQAVALLQVVSSRLSWLARDTPPPAARQELLYVTGRAQICAQLGLHLLGPAADISEEPTLYLDLANLHLKLVASHRRLAEQMPNRAGLDICRFVVHVGWVCHQLACHV